MSNMTHFLMELNALLRRHGAQMLLFAAVLLMLVSQVILWWDVRRMHSHLTNEGQEKHLELWVEEPTFTPGEPEIPDYPVYEAKRKIAI